MSKKIINHRGAENAEAAQRRTVRIDSINSISFSLRFEPELTASWPCGWQSAGIFQASWTLLEE
jgi:hypothetical protein